MFSQRLIRPELLDHAEPEEARVNLEDLVRINCRFGGHSTILKTLGRVVPKNQAFSLLDIGAASGDSARVIQKAYPLATTTSLDYSLVNCERAPMPKLYEYLGVIVFFYSNEHEPVHVHGRHGFYESKIKLVEEKSNNKIKIKSNCSPATAPKTCCANYKYSQAHESICSVVLCKYEVDPTRKIV